MQMKRFIHGLAALPFLAGVAWAHDPVRLEPVRLTSQQMDKVNGGHLEIDVSNTSTLTISLFGRAYLTEPTGNHISCSSCFLVINSPTFAIAAKFGP